MGNAESDERRSASVTSNSANTSDWTTGTADNTSDDDLLGDGQTSWEVFTFDDAHVKLLGRAVLPARVRDTDLARTASNDAVSDAFTTTTTTTAATTTTTTAAGATCEGEAQGAPVATDSNIHKTENVKRVSSPHAAAEVNDLLESSIMVREGPRLGRYRIQSVGGTMYEHLDDFLLVDVMRQHTAGQDDFSRLAIPSPSSDMYTLPAVYLLEERNLVKRDLGLLTSSRTRGRGTTLTDDNGRLQRLVARRPQCTEVVPLEPSENTEVFINGKLINNDRFTFLQHHTLSQCLMRALELSAVCNEDKDRTNGHVSVTILRRHVYVHVPKRYKRQLYESYWPECWNNVIYEPDYLRQRRGSEVPPTATESTTVTPERVAVALAAAHGGQQAASTMAGAAAEWQFNRHSMRLPHPHSTTDVEGNIAFCGPFDAFINNPHSTPKQGYTHPAEAPTRDADDRLAPPDVGGVKSYNAPERSNAPRSSSGSQEQIQCHCCCCVDRVRSDGILTRHAGASDALNGAELQSTSFESTGNTEDSAARCDDACGAPPSSSGSELSYVDGLVFTSALHLDVSLLKLRYPSRSVLAVKNRGQQEHNVHGSSSARPHVPRRYVRWKLRKAVEGGPAFKRLGAAVLDDFVALVDGWLDKTGASPELWKCEVDVRRYHDARLSQELHFPPDKRTGATSSPCNDVVLQLSLFRRLFLPQGAIRCLVGGLEAVLAFLVLRTDDSFGDRLWNNSVWAERLTEVFSEGLAALNSLLKVLELCEKDRIWQVTNAPLMPMQRNHDVAKLRDALYFGFKEKLISITSLLFALSEFIIQRDVVSKILSDLGEDSKESTGPFDESSPQFMQNVTYLCLVAVYNRLKGVCVTLFLQKNLNAFDSKGNLELHTMYSVSDFGRVCSCCGETRPSGDEAKLCGVLKSAGLNLRTTLATRADTLKEADACFQTCFETARVVYEQFPKLKFLAPLSLECILSSARYQLATGTTLGVLTAREMLRPSLILRAQSRHLPVPGSIPRRTRSGQQTATNRLMEFTDESSASERAMQADHSPDTILSKPGTPEESGAPLSPDKSSNGYRSREAGSTVRQAPVAVSSVTARLQDSKSRAADHESGVLPGMSGYILPEDSSLSGTETMIENGVQKACDDAEAFDKIAAATNMDDSDTLDSGEETPFQSNITTRQKEIHGVSELNCVLLNDLLVTFYNVCSQDILLIRIHCNEAAFQDTMLSDFEGHMSRQLEIFRGRFYVPPEGRVWLRPEASHGSSTASDQDIEEISSAGEPGVAVDLAGGEKKMSPRSIRAIASKAAGRLHGGDTDTSPAGNLADTSLDEHLLELTFAGPESMLSHMIFGSTNFFAFGDRGKESQESLKSPPGDAAGQCEPMELWNALNSRAAQEDFVDWLKLHEWKSTSPSVDWIDKTMWEQPGQLLTCAIRSNYAVESPKIAELLMDERGSVSSRFVEKVEILQAVPFPVAGRFLVRRDKVTIAKSIDSLVTVLQQY